MKKILLFQLLWRQSIFIVPKSTDDVGVHYENSNWEIWCNWIVSYSCIVVIGNKVLMGIMGIIMLSLESIQMLVLRMRRSMDCITECVFRAFMPLKRLVFEFHNGYNCVCDIVNNWLRLLLLPLYQDGGRNADSEWAAKPAFAQNAHLVKSTVCIIPMEQKFCSWDEGYWQQLQLCPIGHPRLFPG